MKNKIDSKMREPQYQYELEVKEKYGLAKLGIMTNQCWQDDPRRMAFVFARYKFVAKMLSGKTNVVEVGCGDAFATRIVQQEVGKVTAVDFDPIFINDVFGSITCAAISRFNLFFYVRHLLLPGALRGHVHLPPLFPYLLHIVTDKLFFVK